MERPQGRLSVRLAFPPDTQLTDMDLRLSAQKRTGPDLREVLSLPMDFSWCFSAFSPKGPSPNPRVLRPIAAPFGRNTLENDFLPLVYPDELENIPP